MVNKSKNSSYFLNEFDPKSLGQKIATMGEKIKHLSELLSLYETFMYNTKNFITSCTQGSAEVEKKSKEEYLKIWETISEIIEKYFFSNQRPKFFTGSTM